MLDSEAVRRGERAAEVLGNPAFQEAVERLRREVVDAWEQCPARDSEGKEYYWQLYKNTGKFCAILQGYIEGGKAVKLREKQSAMQGVSRFFRKDEQARR